MSTRPTKARINANRLNAQKSTGPKTPKGKAAASKNSLKHGLSAAHDVIITETQEDYDFHRDTLLTELNPQTPMESILANRIVSLAWRLERAATIQNQTIDAMDEKIKHPPLPALQKMLNPNAEHQDPALTLGRLALKDFANEKVLDRLLMYERRLENSLYKTTHELQNLQLLRQLTPQTAGTPSNQPSYPKSPIPIMPKSPPRSFSRRRHDDAPPPHEVQIPTHHRPIINNQSSIVNDHNDLFMQNEPNPKNTKTTLTPFNATSYNNKPPRPTQENEPNSNPTKPNLPTPRPSPLVSRLHAGPQNQCRQVAQPVPFTRRY